MAVRSLFRKALNVFDPKWPLQGRELDRYYVARPYAPLEPMKTYLRESDQHVKVLFSGHRGSGKSTELARLAKDLEKKFFVVSVSARSLNLADLSYVDVILTSAAALFRTATNEAAPVAIPNDLLRDVLQWLTSEITQETTITTMKSRSLGAKITALLFSLEAKYSRETSTRDTVRQRLYPRLNDLIDRMNAVCGAVEQCADPPLIIFEDIDKTDLAHARELFFEHAITLNSPACRVIYTFPIPLCYSNEFTERVGDYSRHFLLPNVSLYTPQNTPNPQGRDALRAVVARRITTELFARGVLDEIIELSGGLMRNLVRFVADAALLALTERSPAITPDIVRRVAAEIANDYRRLLLPEHYAALRQARDSKQIIPGEAVRQLLENLSLLEYRNESAWCDVHPIVRQLLGAP